MEEGTEIGRDDTHTKTHTHTYREEGWQMKLACEVIYSGLVVV